MARKADPIIRDFLLRNIPDHPRDIAPFAAKEFGVTRATISNYLRQLQREGTVLGGGKTAARTYELAVLDKVEQELEITPSIQEDVIWRDVIMPHMKGLRENIIDICNYGFNEMLNNVVDHSSTTTCNIILTRTYANVELKIRDFGVGIFENIRRTFGLLDRKHALLELSKGKLTTDRSRHTGEGIFFTSRMFTQFIIMSNDLYYTKRYFGHEWLLESGPNEEDIVGTAIIMKIATNSQHTSQSVFEQYTDDESRFSRTHIPLILAKYEGEKLLSRSQAKRILARAERFTEILLDFNGINEIGQPFADEIFRVFQAAHPSIQIFPLRTTPAIDRMIQHARANALADQQPELPFWTDQESS
ncbi:MAG: DUF4325 domain-containing protein [Methylobacteriaceae bacterium]|nr:DUF4325 domain-containing protein [Methylobacteriaceae bacterium]